MPNTLDKFFHALEYYDAGDTIIENPEIQRVIDNAKKLGFDTLDTLKDYYEKQKTKLSKPKALTKSISETAFLENEKDITTLNEVTKPELTEHITFSNIIKNVSYGVRDLSATAKYKDKEHGQTFGVRIGDKMGINYKKGNDKAYTYASLEHNIYNGSTRLEYSINNPIESYGISIYHYDKNVGCTLHYSNRNGLSAAISGDTKSISASVGYTHQYRECKVSVRGFISTQNTRLDNFYNRESECKAGICGNVTF